jgi:hypothetical protein
MRKYLSHITTEQILQAHIDIDNLRERDNRDPLVCAVVEKDWPEYEKVWEMIEERVKREKRIKEVTVQAYQASDGTMFFDKEEAERYDASKEVRYYSVGILFMDSLTTDTVFFEVTARPGEHLDILSDFINRVALW